jgi:hypothetical protein
MNAHSDKVLKVCNLIRECFAINKVEIEEGMSALILFTASASRVVMKLSHAEFRIMMIDMIDELEDSWGNG